MLLPPLDILHNNITMSIVSVLLAVCSCTSPLCAAGVLGNLPFILTLQPQDAVRPLWCCFPVIITITAAGRQGQVLITDRLLSVSTKLFIWQVHKVCSGEKWGMYRKRKSACQQLAQLGLTACRCSWGTSEEEITSASGTTAGLWCSSTAHWNNCL